MKTLLLALLPIGAFGETDCKDEFDTCTFFAELGLCALEEVRLPCQNSCKECGNDEEELNLHLKSGFGIDCGRCQDEDPIFCSAFKNQLDNECKKQHVQEKCQRSCDLCEPDVLCPKFQPYGSTPAQSYWGDWSLWTKCTKKCGMGVQFRRKKCIKDDDGNTCDKSETFTQLRPCMIKKCDSTKSHIRKLDDRRDYYNCCDSISIKSAMVEGDNGLDVQKYSENGMKTFGVYKKLQGKTFNKRAVYKRGDKFLYCQPSRTERNLKMWIVSEELGAHNGDLIVEFESDAACPSDSPIGLWSHNIDPTSDWKQDTSITVKCNDDCIDRPMCVQFANNDNACMDLMVMNQCPILCGTCQPY